MYAPLAFKYEGIRGESGGVNATPDPPESYSSSAASSSSCTSGSLSASS